MDQEAARAPRPPAPAHPTMLGGRNPPMPLAISMVLGRVRTATGVRRNERVALRALDGNGTERLVTADERRATALGLDVCARSKRGCRRATSRARAGSCARCAACQRRGASLDGWMNRAWYERAASCVRPAARYVLAFRVCGAVRKLQRRICRPTLCSLTGDAIGLTS
jgi:hypothetical protein